MNSPPNAVQVQLSDGDVKESTTSVLESMNRLREETIADRRIGDEKKDEYLHLSYRLASALKGLASGNPDLMKKMSLVGEELDSNPLLIAYDPLQEGYWRKTNVKFARALDDVLIELTKEDFRNIGAKHHVLQAVKYLGVEGEDMGKRAKVYDTILPFQSAVPFAGRKDIIGRALASVFGSNFDIENMDGISFRARGDVDSLDALVEEARSRGYRNVNMVMSVDDFKDVQKLRADASMLGEAPEDESAKVGRKILAYAIKATLPVSIPIIGSLPENLRNRLKNYIAPEWNITSDNWDAGMFLSSEVLELVVGGATTVGSYNYMDGIPSLLGITAGIYMVGEVINRFAKVGSNAVCGTTLLKPLELLFKRGGDGKQYDVRIPIERQSDRVEDKTKEVIEYMERVAASRSTDRNLVWSPINHHQFGKNFLKGFERDKPAEINTGVDVEAGNVSFDYDVRVGDYSKRTSLFCRAGEKYIVTSIYPIFDEKGKPIDDSRYLHNIGVILSGGEVVSSKLNRIRETVDARFVHLRRYESREANMRDLAERNKLTNDMEVTA